MKLIHTTNRLLLKVITPDYSWKVLEFYKNNQDFFELYEPDRVSSFYTELFQRTNLQYEYEHFLKGIYLRLWIFEKERPNDIIGTLCFSNIIRSAFLSCMVGYKIDASHCNQGYATESLSYAIHEIIFKEYGLHRVEALIHPTNEPSLRLMDKLQFQYEGFSRKSIRLNGNWEDHLRYSITKQ